MRVHQTSKLFYGKYPYRVETTIAGASRISLWGVDKTMKWCCGDILLSHWETFTADHKMELYKFAESLKECKAIGIKTRAEWETMNLYCPDLATYKIVKQRFKKWIYSLTEPANADDLARLSSKPSQNLCKRLPHNRYTHKVFIRYNMAPHQRLKFMEWLETYKGSVKPSKGTIKWMRGDYSYLQDPFVYVDNPRQLTLVGMFLGNNIKKVQEFVLQDA